MDRKVLLKDLNLPLAIIESDTSYVLTKSNNHNAISRLYGLQATFTATDIIRSVHMNAEVNLTFAKSDDSFPDLLQLAENYFANFRLLPKHYGQLKLSFQPAKKLYIQVSSIWESSWLRLFIPVKSLYNQIIHNRDGFYSMDIVADYSIGTNLHAFIKAANIFNEKYGGLVYSVMNTPLPYNPQSGRNLQAGLTYTFN
jgi:outer membrane receptor protein involved in Fe transport